MNSIAPPTAAPPDSNAALRQAIANFQSVRSTTESLAEPLAAEDCVVQSMPDVSPTKWHLAHTTWFFETFLLKPFVRGYRSRVPEYAYLFNSYYNAAGPMHARDRRGMITRPTVSETLAYRRQADEAVAELLETPPDDCARILELVTLGLHHEQQHQELLLTDIKHVLAQNPLHPVYAPAPAPSDAPAPPLAWTAFPEGLEWIGFEGAAFCYDNERPRHRQFLDAFELASRPVTNGEFLEFIQDGGYDRPDHWLSLGWQTVQQFGWKAPLYWNSIDHTWRLFTLSGLQDLRENEPVAHVSYFEADAYARWAGARLPTEAEWEVATQGVPIEGNFVETRSFHPRPAPSRPSTTASQPLLQLYGDVWEWTQSAYLPYPGFVPPKGALGEYNGKFMCNQMVLRGGSCATSQSHIRPTYRNFFMPDKQWQFSGIRLARSPRSLS